MKTIAIPAFLFCLSLASPEASASVATFGNSTQTVTFTGIGGNALGEGQNKVQWGDCVFGGTNTVCTVSAPFTGVGEGGTIALVITYPGNGPLPVTATSISPGSNYANLNLTAGSFVVTLTEINGPTVSFYQTPNWNFLFATPTCSGVSSCGVGQVGLTPGATITGPVNGMFDTTPVIAPTGVVTASSYGESPAIAPGTWIEIYGENLATVLSRTWAASDFNGYQAPTALAGTTVSVGGQPAYTYFVTPGQVDVQVPSTITPGLQPVTVTTAGGTSLPVSVMVNVTEPGLLAPANFHLPAGQYVAAQFPDGFTYALPPGAVPGVHSARVVPGQTIVLYGVGFGTVTPDIPAGLIVTQSNNLAANFQASFAGTPATVNFAGLVADLVGLYQFNVVVPNVAASDSVPFTFSVGGTPGKQNLIIAVGN